MEILATPGRFFYLAKVANTERNAGLNNGVVNDHCTVKPIDACAATLLLLYCRLRVNRHGDVSFHFPEVDQKLSARCWRGGMKWSRLNRTLTPCIKLRGSARLHWIKQ